MCYFSVPQIWEEMHYKNEYPLFSEKAPDTAVTQESQTPVPANPAGDFLQLACAIP